MFKAKRSACLGLFLFFFVISISPQDSGIDESKKIEEYNLINQRLNIVQQQALSDDEILKKSDEFTEKLETEMIKKSPSVKEKLEHRNDIISDYEEAREMNDEKRMADLQHEFKLLSEEILLHQIDALQNADLKAEGDKLEAAVLNKMEQIDPEVPQLIARLETLENELQEIEREFKN